MFLLLVGSAWNDSAIMDELAHIPAGYSYVTQFDYRLNPEHPPVLKALAGLSARIFVHPNFPLDTKAWTQDINGQWDQGTAFLYNAGNNPDQLIFWSRLPLLLLTIFLGWLIFWWTKKHFGFSAALMTLLLYAFSPTILTHGRYVTTDVGAALGFFMGYISFLKFIEKPDWKNIFCAGICFGIAELLKFSLVLLIPMYTLLVVAWVWALPHLDVKERWRTFIRLGLKAVAVGIIGFLLVWGVYGVLTWNYPQSRQLADTEFTLGSHPSPLLKKIDLALVRHSLTRPLGQYTLGVLMVGQRAAGGNTAYFLGDVSTRGSRLYFPLLYLLKEPLAFHVITLIALGFAWKKFRNSSKRGLKLLIRLRIWIETHFPEFAAFTFIVVYWAVSIKSPLNIGIRHVLPTFPFIYILVSKQIAEWLRAHDAAAPQNWFQVFRNLFQIFARSIPKYLIVSFLFLWLISHTLFVYPHFMSYYNELAGGPMNGYKFAVDSNYDWGQDLLRLKDYVTQHHIDKIYLDYFGGGNPKYYMGDKFIPWQSSKGYPPKLMGGPSTNSGQTPDGVWFAVSATLRQNAFGNAAPDFIRSPEESYLWLRPYPPVAQIGYSIFVYKLP